MSSFHAQSRTRPRGLELSAALEILDRPVAPRPALARAVFFAIALALGGHLLGCSRPEECRLASDCQRPLFCVEGHCVAECREDRDCSAGERCQDGRCAVRGVDQRLCASAIDCEQGETCAGGACAPVRLAPVDAGAEPDAGSEPVDSGPLDAGAPDQGPAVEPPLLPYGAPCARGSECETGRCLGPAGGSTGRCTDECASDADCFYPDACLDIPGAGRLCGQSPTGRPPGAPCPNGPGDCSSGLCVQTMSGSGPICTQECGALPACPVGLTCQPVPDGAGSAVAVCIEGVGSGFGQTCSASADCATGLCVDVGGRGVCTSLCAQVPCPRGWTCTAAEDAVGGRVRICAPDGAVGGRFGDACTGASGCASGLCLFDSRTGGSFCTAPCSGPADCAAVPGLACVTLASGARVCGPR